MKLNHLIFLFSLFLVNLSYGQALLTKAEAAKITLENNYDIKLASNDIIIAEQNTSKVLNGYRPTVNANAGLNSNFGGSRTKFATGNEIEINNAFSWGGSAAVTGNYTLYDQNREETIKQLRELVSLSGLQKQLTIEQQLLQLFNVYYEVAQISANLGVLQRTLSVSRQRVLRAQYRFEYGQGPRLDLLNAEVDYQRDSINFLNSQQLLSNARRNLNVIMGMEVNSSFKIDTTITYIPDLTLPALTEKAKARNTAIQLINKNLDITQQEFNIIDAGKKPTLGATGSYSYNFSDNPEQSFTSFSTNNGLALGLNLNWNLFDGGIRKKRKEITQINIASQQIQKTQLEQQLERDVMNAWESYQTSLYILQAELTNFSTAKLNMERTEEQFKIGQISSVEFRQAQLNLLNAETSYNTSKYSAKVIELQLLQLSGELLEKGF